ncbi:ABC transporter substrate-binding protein [Phyllobacterium myrsinacearum]|uniref:Peptide/nickel transport system substrate-binding protein n=1 Tax=Phyllobacterium myrsinacearum TaxID=28101 RepID=A0A839EX66_9HYPH|nr:ABC transporter substrate-binding protein [Phyllobacterium myrsinacearum]MBA8880987.1 peptide/nickel transport system substrate-binding protein [Phyllobacterium myrsinacearum]
MLSKRDFLQLLGIGFVAAGTTKILGPDIAAAADLPAWAALPEGASPKSGGKLVYGQTYPNWAIGTSGNGKHPYYWIDLLTRSIWNCLIWVDHDFKLQGELAESWQPADESLTVWDFKLREGVMFHNGREMTSADAVASINAHVAQKGSSFINKWFNKVEAQGQYGIRFTLNAPYAEWPFALAEYRIAIVPSASPELILTDGIGTGPFKLVEVDNRRGFRAVRNENYWLKGRPFLDELEGYIVNSQTAVNGFRSGQFNAVFNIDPTTSGQYESTGGIIHKSKGGDQFLLSLPKNLNLVWNDPRIRLAISLAVDRDAINTIVYKDPGSWVGNDTHMSGLNAEFQPRAKPYDPETAKRLLAEAGHPSGLNLPAMVYCPSFPEEPKIMAIVAESLKKAGINIDIREMPCDGFNDYVVQVNGPIGRPARSLVGPRNPAINLGRMVTNASEAAGWKGPKADEFASLYGKAIAEPDEAKRTEMYHELQSIVQSDTPALVLGGRRNMLAHAPSVQNLRSHSQNWSSRFDDVWINV